VPDGDRAPASPDRAPCRGWRDEAVGASRRSWEAPGLRAPRSSGAEEHRPAPARAGGLLGRGSASPSWSASSGWLGEDPGRAGGEVGPVALAHREKPAAGHRAEGWCGDGLVGPERTWPPATRSRRGGRTRPDAAAPPPAGHRGGRPPWRRGRRTLCGPWPSAPGCRRGCGGGTPRPGHAASARPGSCRQPGRPGPYLPRTRARSRRRAWLPAGRSSCAPRASMAVTVPRGAVRRLRGGVTGPGVAEPRGAGSGPTSGPERGMRRTAGRRWRLQSGIGRRSCRVGLWEGPHWYGARASGLSGPSAAGHGSPPRRSPIGSSRLDQAAKIPRFQDPEVSPLES
jgi:hypothetical protein